MTLTRRSLIKSSIAAAGATALPGLARAQDGVLKIGQVNASPAGEIGWAKTHALGMDAIRETFGDRVEVTVVDNTFLPQDAERVFREMASTGHGLIFGHVVLAWHADAAGRAALSRRAVGTLLGHRSPRQPRHLRGEIL